MKVNRIRRGKGTFLKEGWEPWQSGYRRILMIVGLNPGAAYEMDWQSNVFVL